MPATCCSCATLGGLHLTEPSQPSRRLAVCARQGQQAVPRGALRDPVLLRRVGARRGLPGRHAGAAGGCCGWAESREEAPFGGRGRVVALSSTVEAEERASPRCPPQTASQPACARQPPRRSPPLPRPPHHSPGGPALPPRAVHPPAGAHRARGAHRPRPAAAHARGAALLAPAQGCAAGSRAMRAGRQQQDWALVTLKQRTAACVLPTAHSRRLVRPTCSNCPPLPPLQTCP